MEFLLVIVSLGIFGLIPLHFYKKNINYVQENSKLIISLLSLNDSYNFHQIDNMMNYKEHHDKKAKFDRDSEAKFMNRHIYENMNSYIETVNLSDDNGQLYTEYIEKYDFLKTNLGFTVTSRDDIKMRNKKFNKIENKLYKKLVLKKPTIDFNIEYSINYTSPKGRNSYLKRTIYTKSVINKEIEDILKDIENKKTRQYIIKNERSKMTDSLRYEVLKRDKNCCQICGSTVKDGVKLHVDHIIPVSKGGKTVKSNLQTLCDRCNLGKSNKL